VVEGGRESPPLVNAVRRDGRDALLLHGFTGSARDLSSLADALGERGFRVDAPTLPGHGTSPRDLARTRWPDWERAANAALYRLGERVAVAGLSMGALLAIRLAVEHPDRVAALALLSTPLWLSAPAHAAAWIGRIVPYLPKGAVDVRDPVERKAAATGYRLWPLAALRSLLDLAAEARELAPRVRAPALVVHARNDHVAALACADELERTLGGPVRRITLERSFHVITRDVERVEVASLIGGFFQEMLS